MLDVGLHYYDSNIPCLAACPVHTNAGMYVAAIADHDDLTAYHAARLPNPFASVCGRVCAAPCEDACRRGVIDQPIAIRALKRFVTERYGVEGADSRWLAATVDPAQERPESIAIVGAGPAGLSAAHDLRQLGYQVDLLEATNSLGGMMALGIPEYRLDRSLLQAEIDAVVSLGVDVRLGTRLGVDVTLESLRAEHDAVFLSIGASLGRGLDIEGHDSDGVFRAIEFLLNVNQGFQVDIGARVVVIGGGNVAMDAARTALRASAYEAGGDEVEARDVTEAVDVARTALRAGATDVTIISLESMDELPAARFEVEEAMEEGIRFVPRRGPQRICVEGGRVVGVDTIGVTSVFDDAGRFAPTFDPDDRRIFEADTAILAIGQAVDLDALGSNGPVLTPMKTIEVQNDSLLTSLPDVWAGGDAAHGPRNLVDAIADGRRVAASIHEALGGEPIASAEGRLTTIDRFSRLADDYVTRDRADVPVLPTDRRIGVREVELGFDEEQARAEAARCLRCFANIQLDVMACVLCGLCVDVCPVDVISLVPAVEIGGTAGTALLLDESACIRCGLCIERCPPCALSMAIWSGAGVPVAVGGST